VSFPHNIPFPLHHLIYRVRTLVRRLNICRLAHPTPFLDAPCRAWVLLREPHPWPNSFYDGPRGGSPGRTELSRVSYNRFPFLLILLINHSSQQQELDADIPYSLCLHLAVPTLLRPSSSSLPPSVLSIKRSPCEGSSATSLLSSPSTRSSRSGRSFSSTTSPSWSISPPSHPTSLCFDDRLSPVAFCLSVLVSHIQCTSLHAFHVPCVSFAISLLLSAFVPTYLLSALPIASIRAR
jgi:hypothetical protein